MLIQAPLDQLPNTSGSDGVPSKPWTQKPPPRTTGLCTAKALAQNDDILIAIRLIALVLGDELLVGRNDL